MKILLERGISGDSIYELRGVLNCQSDSLPSLWGKTIEPGPLPRRLATLAFAASSGNKEQDNDRLHEAVSSCETTIDPEVAVDPHPVERGQEARERLKPRGIIPLLADHS
ncbi:MAG: hypothetical protein HY682_07460 [Chloroflexi bacterium]|nr:hypothetical protein [Chloroflexota bacterium]